RLEVALDILADGPIAGAYSSSGAGGNGDANAAAGSDGATSDGSGTGGASTYSDGYTYNP
ncbi:hypothetical protein, partial [Escherichia coli]|uniref:hypothetical protein n=1 Tax=Escherichia coli TaxID=562 RepID=UPI003F75C262|nr:hypothetical protein [Escherichia coli]